MWWSKNLVYEKPYCVTGTIKLTGVKSAPKDICTDRVIGTRKGIRFPFRNRQTKNNKLLNWC